MTEDWTMWEPYHSPNLAPVIQEVIDREGWQSGNALTLFMMGQDQGASLLDNARDFESYENIEDPDDGGDGLHHPERIPTLKIYFTTGVTSVRKNPLNTQDNSWITLFPNPVDNGVLHINSEKSGPLTVEIYNVTGRLVKFHEQGSPSMELDVSDLHEGFYVVKTTQQGAADIQKVIIR
jgi:hypothetical protein